MSLIFNLHISHEIISYLYYLSDLYVIFSDIQRHLAQQGEGGYRYPVGHQTDTKTTMPTRITDRLVKDLPSPPKGNKISYDSEIRGFGIRVTAKGAKSFIINYTINSRERRFTIGEYPAWSVAAARAQAVELRREIDKGIDPLQQRIDEREAPTIIDLFKEYESKHLPTKAKRSQSDDRSMWRTYILPILGENTKVADVTAKHVDDLHGEIKKDKPVRANRVIEVLRKAFNLAVRWEWRADNPCQGLAWAPEQQRERYLSKAELERLAEALDNHPDQQACDAIRLLIFTGARKSEVLRATWEMFDLDTGTWVKPSHHTKQRRSHRVPLSTPAAALLREIKTRAVSEEGGSLTSSSYIFINRNGNPLDDLQKIWRQVRESAQVFDVRIHDLRHTYASILVSAGLSLPTVGALLGHTQAQTTLRYAHLHQDPLRLATEHAATALDYKKQRAAAATDDKR